MNSAKVTRCSRVACLIVAIFVLTVRKEWAFIFSGASPFVVTVGLLTTLTFRATMALGLLLGLLALIKHRWFCKWICPVGFCLDAVSRTGQRAKRRSHPGTSWGKWLVWITLGGVILGYPVFLWLDPLSLFSSIFLVKEQADSPMAWISPLCVLALCLLTFWWPHIWCTRICPLGAFQDMLTTGRKMASSLKQTFSLPKHTPGTFTTRRALLGLALGTSGAAAISLPNNTNIKTLRPPGAMSYPEFLGLCTRCGNCIRVCPSQIIERDPGDTHWTGVLTPRLTFSHDYCREDCVVCTQVCPSGALRLLNLDRKSQIQIGTAQVDMDLCLLSDDRECAACKRWCPYDAIQYEFSQELYTLFPVIDVNRCTGCGACQAHCPTSPKKAITVS